MKFRLFLGALLIFNISVSQITLENTYTNAKPFSFRIAQIDENTLVYYYLNENADTIEIFDLGHNSIKTITVPSAVRNSRNYIRALHLTKYLFDSDDEYEYSVSFFNESGSTFFYSFYVLNEDGTILLDGSDFDISSTVGSGQFDGTFGIFKTLSGDLKLVLDRLNSDSSINEIQVYDLPGVNFELSIDENNPIFKNTKVAPNPTIQKRNTIYHNFLSQGKVIIYDEMGKRVKEIALDRSKKETKIDLSDQASGLYFYELYNGNDKIGEKKVLVH